MIRRTGLKPWVMVVAPLFGVLVVGLAISRLDRQPPAPLRAPAPPAVDAITGRPPTPDELVGSDKVVEVAAPSPLSRALLRWIEDNAVEARTAQALLSRYEEREAALHRLDRELQSGALTKSELVIQQEALHDRHALALKQLLDEEAQRSLREHLRAAGQVP